MKEVNLLLFLCLLSHLWYWTYLNGKSNQWKANKSIEGKVTTCKCLRGNSNMREANRNSKFVFVQRWWRIRGETEKYIMYIYKLVCKRYVILRSLPPTGWAAEVVIRWQTSEGEPWKLEVVHMETCSITTRDQITKLFYNHYRKNNIALQNTTLVTK